MTKHNETSQKNTGLTKTHSKPGPKSIAGKNKVSKNALKNGATTSRLLNPEEHQIAEQFIKTMTHQYGKQAAVQLQIERAARVHVQLNRVQSTIDNLYYLASRTASENPTLKNQLNMDDHQWLDARVSVSPLVAKYFAHQLRKNIPKNDELSKLAQLIPKISIDNFLAAAPRLANYLHNQAKQQKITLTVYLHNLIGSHHKEDHLYNQIGTIIDAVNNESTLSDPQEIEENFLTLCGNNVLQRFVNWYGNYYSYAQETQYKIARYHELLDVHKGCALPDLDVIDRLMRYQTSLQKQFSAILGQIHVLANNQKLLTASN